MNIPPRSGRLFSETATHQPPVDAYLAEIDGASRGNPGPASYGVVLRSPDGGVEWKLGKCIGTATNNVAEYYALLAALEGAAARGVRGLRVRSDSLLMVRQMQGRYKVKSADLRPLHERATKAARALQYFAIEYVPREQNRAADRLANYALDNKTASHAMNDRSAIGPDTSQHGDPSDLTQGEHALPKDGTELSSKSPADTSVRTPRKPRGKRLLARYSSRALHLAEPLELREGEEVKITIHFGKK
jgi:probable phosphoglycerate mutase